MRAFQLGEGSAHRKQWIEDRLQESLKIFPIGVGGGSQGGKWLHLLLSLDLARTNAWSAEEVARPWLLLSLPKDRFDKPIKVTPAWISSRTQLAA